MEELFERLYIARNVKQFEFNYLMLIAVRK
jgi:hypothetical protein